METLLCFKHIRLVPAGVLFSRWTGGRLFSTIFNGVKQASCSHLLFPSKYTLTSSVHSPIDTQGPAGASHRSNVHVFGLQRGVLLLCCYGGNAILLHSDNSRVPQTHAHLESCCSRVNSECNQNKRGSESTPRCVLKQTGAGECGAATKATRENTHPLPVSASIRCVSYFQASPFLLRCDCLTWITMALGRT